MRGDFVSQIEQLQKLIDEYPNLRIAIGHFGMVTRENWLEQIKLAKNKNVFIESGGITWLFNAEFYPYSSAVKAINEAADLVGFEKLMWGSDYPRTMTAITYKMSLDFVEKTYNSATILNGDILDNATQTSISNTHDENLPPEEVVDYLVEKLEPLAKQHKIIAITPGNHDSKSGKRGVR